MNDLPLSALSECADRLRDKYKTSVLVELQAQAWIINGKPSLENQYRIHVLGTAENTCGAVANDCPSLADCESKIQSEMDKNTPANRAAKLNAQAAELQAQAAKLLEQSQIK